MATKTDGDRKEVWLGNDAPNKDGWFNGGNLWIGRHSADGDILVFDPEVSDPAAGNVSLFSLTQFRHRVFPRSVVAARIPEVTDPDELARAEQRYREWPALKEEREQERAVERGEVAERQRQGAIDRHRHFMEERGVPYEGVRDTGTGKTAGARRRRTKCHSCGIALDDFAASECLVCGGVLCSCGACGCGAPVRER
ncbi:MAG TPA: hypothetical protein VGR37_23215 [Longimicrobiaceae bacterium]|nr:hypothetical protein [Longimicrobiaceae bacterium]